MSFGASRAARGVFLAMSSLGSALHCPVSPLLRNEEVGMQRVVLPLFYGHLSLPRGISLRPSPRIPRSLRSRPFRLTKGACTFSGAEGAAVRGGSC